MNSIPLETKVLGQLLLMQSIVINLPDLRSIQGFICKGMEDIPGVGAVFLNENTHEDNAKNDELLCFPIEQNSSFYGELVIHLSDPERFSPYLDHVNNFVFMLGIILEERKQRAQNAQYRAELESSLRRQKEATEELATTNEELSAINNELFDKNQIIQDQNEELEATLLNLKQTQTQLIQSEKMASLGVLTAGVAHEINNPLNFIQAGLYSLSNLLEEEQIQNQEKVELIRTAIQTGVDRAVAIVKSLGQFSRSNTSSGEGCNLYEIIDNCLTMLQNKLKHKVKVEKEYQPNLPKVLGNCGKLHQVFLNIINNAEQAIEKEGTISITVEAADGNVRVEISDSGQGIPKENMNKIIEPFFTTKNPGEGTGLGLSITYKIIQEHKGKLFFSSEVNKGTKVTVVLPLKP